MSQILTPGERSGAWQTVGDHDRRIRALEANPSDCCVPEGVQSVADWILANPCAVALWKMNESTGTVAADSVNGYDLDSAGFNPPTWGATPMIGTDTAATFAAGATRERVDRAAFPALDAGDFTALVFLRRNGTSFDPIMGQGDTVSSGGNGFYLAVEAFNQGSGNRLYLAKGPGTNTLEGSVAITTTAIHLAMVTFDLSTNTWTLWLDGVNIGSEVDAWTSTTGFWIGNATTSGGSEPFDGDLAYAAVFNCVLTDNEIAELWALYSAGGGLIDGYVLTADSTAAAGWSWQPSTIEVEIP